jgi:hypothetical protein
MKNSVCWNIILCSPVEDSRRFGGTYGLHLQDLRIRQARNQRVAASKQSLLVNFRKKVVVAYFEALFQHSPKGTKNNQLTLEPGTSRMALQNLLDRLLNI